MYRTSITGRSWQVAYIGHIYFSTLVTVRRSVDCFCAEFDLEPWPSLAIIQGARGTGLASLVMSHRPAPRTLALQHAPVPAMLPWSELQKESPSTKCDRNLTETVTFTAPWREKGIFVERKGAATLKTVTICPLLTSVTILFLHSSTS